MTCPHYWLIEPVAGPTSQGTCRLCGAAKEFPNIPAFMYNNARPKPRKKEATK